MGKKPDGSRTAARRSTRYVDFIEEEDLQQLTPQSPCTSTSTIAAAFGSERCMVIENMPTL
jgi:hypothetical protein